jgi:hypothetical protein
MKKITTLLTAILLIATTATAQQATFNFTTGTGTGTGWSFNATYGTLSIQSNADIRITGETDNGSIRVESRNNVKITLDGVNITKVDGNVLYADESDITLTLVGENTLVGGTISTGIRLPWTNASNILTINGNGSLNVSSGLAGIGVERGATLNINSGVVFASSIDNSGSTNGTVNYNGGIVFVGDSEKDKFDRAIEFVSTLNGTIKDLSAEVSELKADTTHLHSLIRALELDTVKLNDSIRTLLQQLADCEKSGTSNANLLPQEHIQVFPNPVNYELQITNYEWNAGDVVELFDMNGRRVYTRSLSGTETTIDMSNFQSGNYILRIGSRVAKVVKN